MSVNWRELFELVVVAGVTSLALSAFGAPLWAVAVVGGVIGWNMPLVIRIR